MANWSTTYWRVASITLAALVACTCGEVVLPLCTTCAGARGNTSAVCERVGIPVCSAASCIYATVASTGEGALSRNAAAWFAALTASSQCGHGPGTVRCASYAIAQAVDGTIVRTVLSTPLPGNVSAQLATPVAAVCANGTLLRTSVRFPNAAGRADRVSLATGLTLDAVRGSTSSVQAALLEGAGWLPASAHTLAHWMASETAACAASGNDTVDPTQAVFPSFVSLRLRPSSARLQSVWRPFGLSSLTHAHTRSDPPAWTEAARAACTNGEDAPGALQNASSLLVLHSAAPPEEQLRDMVWTESLPADPAPALTRGLTYAMFPVYRMTLCGAPLLSAIQRGNVVSGWWLATVDPMSMCTALPEPLFEAVMGWLPTVQCNTTSPGSSASFTIGATSVCGVPNDVAQRVLSGNSSLPWLQFALQAAAGAPVVAVPLAALLARTIDIAAAGVAVSATHEWSWCITREALTLDNSVAAAQWGSAMPWTSSMQHPIRFGTLALQTLDVLFNVSDALRRRVGLHSRFPRSASMTVHGECRRPTPCPPGSALVVASNSCTPPSCNALMGTVLDATGTQCVPSPSFTAFVVLALTVAAFLEVYLPYWRGRVLQRAFAVAGKSSTPALASDSVSLSGDSNEAAPQSVAAAVEQAWARPSWSIRTEDVAAVVASDAAWGDAVRETALRAEEDTSPETRDAYANALSDGRFSANAVVEYARTVDVDMRLPRGERADSDESVDEQPVPPHPDGQEPVR